MRFRVSVSGSRLGAVLIIRRFEIQCFGFEMRGTRKLWVYGSDCFCLRHA